MTTFDKVNGMATTPGLAVLEGSHSPPVTDPPTTGWTVWTASMAIISLVLSLDHFDIFQSSIGKAFLSLTAIALLGYYMLMNRFQPNRVPWPVVFWVILMMFAMPGIMYMKLRRSYDVSSPSTLFGAVTMGLLVVSVVFIPIRLLRFDPVAAMKVLAGIGFAFLIGSFVVLAGFGYGVIPRIRVHERAFLLVVPLTYAFLNRRVFLATICLFLMLLVLLINPRTTILLSYAGAFCMIMYHVSSKQTRMIVLPFLCLFLTFFAFNAYEIMKTVNANVKKSASSSDNSTFREEVWALGRQEFYRSPLYGSFFTRGAAYDYGRKLTSEATGEYLDSSLVPLHNDYLEFFASGGVIGGFLFASAIMGVFLMAVRNVTKCRAHYLMGHMKYNQMLSTTLACAMMCMLFNPVINNTQSGFFVYALVSLIIMEHLHLRALGVR